MFPFTFDQLNSLNRQRGNIFLFYALVFITVIMGIIVGQLLPSNNQQARTAADQQVLATAANGVLNWGMSRGVGPTNAPMGMLPFPNTGLPTGYSVCPANPPNQLGYFPYLGERPQPPVGTCRSVSNAPITPLVGGMDLNLHDSSGSLLWYAVATPVLDIPNQAQYPTITPASLTTPAALNRLFTFCDANGNATPQVVFVVFAPGRALPTQNRAAAGVASNFLDTANVGGAAPCSGAINNSNIAGRTFVAANQSDTFNDQLYYVTLTQYLDRLVPAVLNGVVKQMDAYHNIHGSYPTAATVSTYWPGWDSQTTPGTSNWVSTATYDQVRFRFTISSCPQNQIFQLTWNGTSSQITPSFSQC